MIPFKVFCFDENNFTAEKQVRKFTLRTDNPAARKFYEYHGFKYTGEGDVTHEFEL